MATVLWLQGGACSGNTMSFLNAEEPSACDLVTDFGIDLLWHPIARHGDGRQRQRIFEDLAAGRKPLDIFVFEGTVILGPNGSGRFNMFADRPMKDWVKELAAQAGAVVALVIAPAGAAFPLLSPIP